MKAMAINALMSELAALANPQKAAILQRFFKTGKGEYAEGDKFLGVMVPQTRALVKKYWRDIELTGIESFIKSKYHEERLAALLVLVTKFEKGDDSLKNKFLIFIWRTPSPLITGIWST